VPNSADTGKVAGWQDPRQGDFAKPDFEKNSERPAARQPNIVPAGRGRKASLLLAHRHDSISAGMTLPRIQPIAPTWRKTPFDDPDWLFDLTALRVAVADPNVGTRPFLETRSGMPDAGFRPRSGRGYRSGRPHRRSRFPESGSIFRCLTGPGARLLLPARPQASWLAHSTRPLPAADRTHPRPEPSGASLTQYLAPPRPARGFGHLEFAAAAATIRSHSRTMPSARPIA